MNKNKKTQCSVTLFLHCGDEFLFLKRSANKKIDANRLNGIGGKLELGEDFLSAAIRECEEESGIIPEKGNIKLAGVVKVEGGYAEDWVMCFFKIAVQDKKIPLGNLTTDGELMWLKVEEVFSEKFELVDDLHYCFCDIVKNETIFFATYQLDENEKVKKFSRGDLENERRKT